MKIAVLGGGIMGLGIAREMAGQGHYVTLYDRHMRGGDEASRASAGMIGPQSEAMEDDAYFAATLASRDLWPGYAAGLQAETGLDIAFKTQGAIHLAFGGAYEARLEAKYLWQKKKAGRVTRLEGDALRSRFGYLHPRVSAAFLAEGDYWVDNELLCDALEAACRKRGVHFEWGKELSSTEGLDAEAFVITAGAWSSQFRSGLPKTHPVKGQMCEFRVPAELLPELPIHAEFVYLVPRGHDRLLVGATVETVGFDKRLTGEGVEWLLQNAFETIPDLRNCELTRFWSGLRPGASDGWPSLGATGEAGLFGAIGHYRRGILFLPLSVQALSYAIQGQPLPQAAQAFAFTRHQAHAL